MFPDFGSVPANPRTGGGARRFIVLLVRLHVVGFREVGDDAGPGSAQAAVPGRRPDPLASAVRARERGAGLSQRRRARGASKLRARARSTASVRLWVPSLA